MDVVLRWLAPAEVEEIWATALAPIVQDALAYDRYSTDGLRDVHLQLLSGVSRCLLVGVDGRVKAALVAQLMKRSDETRVLHVLCCAGSDMDTWLEQLLEELDAEGSREGCVAVTMAGRIGWMRTLRPHGYRVSQIEMEKPINGREEQRQQPEHHTAVG